MLEVCCLLKEGRNYFCFFFELGLHCWILVFTDFVIKGRRRMELLCEKHALVLIMCGPLLLVVCALFPNCQYACPGNFQCKVECRSIVVSTRDLPNHHPWPEPLERTTWLLVVAKALANGCMTETYNLITPTTDFRCSQKSTGLEDPNPSITGSKNFAKKELRERTGKSDYNWRDLHF